MPDFARVLRDAGMEVIYLGVRQTSESFVSAVEQEDADAVAIALDAADQLAEITQIRQGLRAAGLDTPVILGGDVDAGAAESFAARASLLLSPQAHLLKESPSKCVRQSGSGTAESGIDGKRHLGGRCCRCE